MNIAINGLGRIGRLLLRTIQQYPHINVVALNDVADIESVAHLIKYDSAHLKNSNVISNTTNEIIINDKIIPYYREPIPKNIPWHKHNIDIVVECTGRFTDYNLAYGHIEAKAKRVLLSAPPKEGSDIKTIVFGLNHKTIQESDVIISNASCTTNCFAPIAKVIDENFIIKKGFMSTVHAYTQDQHLQDTPHKNDLRRARAAAYNIVPTSTNAAKAMFLVLPNLKGKISAMAYRVPVINGSLIDFVCEVESDVTIEAVNHVLRNASISLSNILSYSEEHLVSTDIIGNSHSAIIDSKLTEVNGSMIKIVAWYDNEFGYASRLADVLDYLSN